LNLTRTIELNRPLARLGSRGWAERCLSNHRWSARQQKNNIIRHQTQDGFDITGLGRGQVATS